ncbi:MAG: S1 RNA-binding domain-containing protein, partial [Desulfovibrio sp.]|nr:S1 RNA-binding domain-containing protein [Desulfovibrio sp.]
MSEEQVSTGHEDSENFAQMFEEHSQAASEKLETGQKITGSIIAITGDNVFVDVGIKVDGVMDRKDILNAEGEEIVKVGDTIEAWVVKVSSQEIRLSRSLSGSGLAALEDAMNSKMPVEGKITGVCKGGYTVEIAGKRTFCPGSQMEALGEGVECTGRTMQFLILRIENRGRNIIVSRRAVLDRAREENLSKVLETIHVGDVVEGSVSRLVQFGAFVALAEGVEGLVHISELDWSRVNTCEEVVSVGDSVRVKVLGIETTPKGTKISLSRKQAMEDPWLTVGDKLSVGQIVTGKVMRLVNFGAFVEILPGVEGMVHLSEMAWRRVYKAEDVVSVGQSVQVKIKDMDLEHKRIALSIRDAEGDPWQDAEERFSQGSVHKGTV